MTVEIRNFTYSWPSETYLRPLSELLCCPPPLHVALSLLDFPTCDQKPPRLRSCRSFANEASNAVTTATCCRHAVLKRVHTVVRLHFLNHSVSTAHLFNAPSPGFCGLARCIQTEAAHGELGTVIGTNLFKYLHIII